MPIKMGQHMYPSFMAAVMAVKRRKGKKKIRDPKAYVATIERMQKPQGGGR